MAQFDEKTLKSHIKAGEYYPIYLMCGDEDYLKKHYADMIASKNVEPAFESFNLQKFDGKGLDLQDVFEQASIMPMMSDKRCIIVEDYKLEGAGEDTLSQISAYVESIPDTSIVIFHQKSADFSLAKAKKAADIISKHGAVCLLNKRKGNDLIKPLISSASKQNCTLSVQMANYLVSCVGDDFNVLINELHKVCGYVGGGEITRSHIDAVAVKTDEAKIYDLTKALMAKDFDKAYKVLHTLIKNKVSHEYIFGTIVSTYVDMYRGKVSLSCGGRADELAADFDYGKRAFALTNGARDSSKIDLPTLRKCLDVLCEADMKLKMSSDDNVIVLEQLMVRLFLVTNGERV
ncbi:MAG: DNA polymerase III subunit delta [Clostridia bacterium]|nr:DNA polymerase III subunit delta [Clostridia bacterium]